VLFEEPRYAWTYKHIGPTELIGATGALHPTIDIYNNWPGFFAAAAWFSDALGLRPLEFVTWAQPAFAAANLTGVLFAVRGLTTDPRRAWASAWVFLLANWVGQEYFAPQAPAFLLSLVLLGLVLRTAPGATGVPLALRPRHALALGVLLWLALVSTHQLSPVFVLAWIAAFALLTRRLPLWIPIAMAVVEAAWIAQAWPWLRGHVDLFSFDFAASARPPGFDASLALDGAELAKHAQLVVMIALAGVALVGAIRRARAGRWDTVVLAFVLIPAALVTLQRYGGEGPLRAYLFALPFLAFLVIGATGMRRLRLGAITALLVSAAPVAFFGTEYVNRMAPEDLRTAAWVERHAAPEGARVYPSDVAVRELTRSYTRLAGSPLLRLSLEERYVGRRWDGATADRIDRDLRDTGSATGYVVLTPAQDRHLRFYGLTSADAMRSLERALSASPRFTTAHRDGSARVFRWVRDAPPARFPPAADPARTAPPTYTAVIEPGEQVAQPFNVCGSRTPTATQAYAGRSGRAFDRSGATFSRHDDGRTAVRFDPASATWRSLATKQRVLVAVWCG
jgi:hypothetical protein